MRAVKLLGHAAWVEGRLHPVPLTATPPDVVRAHLRHYHDPNAESLTWAAPAPRFASRTIMLPSNVNNALIQRLRQGDLATVEHLLNLGFGPFDTLGHCDLKHPQAPPKMRSLWTWSNQDATSTPEVLDRWGRALLDAVRADPLLWLEQIQTAWKQDDWDLWSIAATDSSTVDSALWRSAWRTATQSLAIVHGEKPEAITQDPGFWTRPAGLRIMSGLAQQLEWPRTVETVDKVWARLVQQGIPVQAWEQPVPLWSSTTQQEVQAPLAWAAKMGAWGMVERLARHGTNPDMLYRCQPEPSDVEGVEIEGVENWSVTPLALCLQGLVLNHGVDNHRSVPAYRRQVAQAMQALIEAGADLDAPSVLMVHSDAPMDAQHPPHRYHDDERGVFCECEPWGGSPSVREVLRAWVDHPDAHAEPVNGVLDGVPVEHVHAWRARLYSDEFRQSLSTLPKAALSPRVRL